MTIEEAMKIYDIIIYSKNERWSWTIKTEDAIIKQDNGFKSPLIAENSIIEYLRNKK